MSLWEFAGRFKFGGNGKVQGHSLPQFFRTASGFNQIGLATLRLKSIPPIRHRDPTVWVPPHIGVTIMWTCTGAPLTYPGGS